MYDSQSNECPQTDPPQRAGKIPHRSSSTATLWGLVMLSFLWMSLTTCMCGHTSWISSVAILPAFGFGLHIFIAIPRERGIEQILGAIAFALLAGMFLKNIGDILYFGHEPLFE